LGERIGEEEKHRSNAQPKIPEIYVETQIKKNYIAAHKFTILSERLQKKKREPHSRTVFTMENTLLCSTY